MVKCRYIWNEKERADKVTQGCKKKTNTKSNTDIPTQTTQKENKGNLFAFGRVPE